MSKRYITALSIAGSDPSGGAGIQADLKTFSALGCYGMSAITALTAQNTQGVQSVHALPADFLLAQLESLWSDIDIAALKLGMLHHTQNIQVLSNFFKAHPIRSIVIDPVMTSKNGNPLLEANAMTLFKNKLLPLALILTPNIPEAEFLLGCTIHTQPDMENAARDLASLGPKAVLLKGGHLKSEMSPDCLYLSESKTFIWITHERIQTPHTHGTGCTLSAAITAFLAHGDSIETAVKKANIYLFEALKAGAHYHLGYGRGPVNHFYNIWSS
ncbi:MAG: bifunctional hydroxymethylpyrimidine kinase/phosphomethylpyrimidine kinase [Gammaproteobacteria bacterium]|nr:bifunctional hydroxymethylpyrimidine kinase/phosphomethylpyrimidine kinase [Gammaproteobacteria bacterium]